MTKIIKRIRSRGEGAQTLAEFAIIMPVLALLIFGIVDIARAMQSYVTIQEAARDGARYAVTGRIDCVGPSVQSRENCIVQAVEDRTQSLADATSVTADYRSWSYPTYADPATEDNAGTQCDAVEVEVNYDYRPMTPIIRTLLGNGIALKARERLVNEPFGPCS